MAKMNRAKTQTVTEIPQALTEAPLSWINVQVTFDVALPLNRLYLIVLLGNKDKGLHIRLHWFLQHFHHSKLPRSRFNFYATL